MKSLVINKELLEKEEITGYEFLYLYYLYSDERIGVTFNDIDNKNLEQRKLIKIIENNAILRQKSIDLIEFSLVEMDISIKNEQKKVKKSDRAISEEVISFIDEFRNKWKGLKPGAMGGKRACITKLTRWVKENPDYTFDQISKAADLYLSTEGRDVRFLQRADYFIYKNDIQRNEMSRLSAYIDDVAQGGTEDWTSNLN